jgi:hypothetical protein
MFYITYFYILEAFCFSFGSCFAFWWYWELNSGHLLGRYSTSWATSSALFVLVVFGIGSCSPGWSGPQISYVCFLCSWDDDRHVPPCPAIGWDGGLANFLPELVLNCDPPNFHLWNSLGFRCEPPRPAWRCFFMSVQSDLLWLFYISQILYIYNFISATSFVFIFKRS